MSIYVINIKYDWYNFEGQEYPILSNFHITDL